MDCEGENHLYGDARVDNLITFISLQIVSVQLINVDKQIGSSDLARLNVSFVSKQMYFIKAIGEFTQKRCLAK